MAALYFAGLHILELGILLVLNFHKVNGLYMGKYSFCWWNQYRIFQELLMVTLSK